MDKNRFIYILAIAIFILSGCSTFDESLIKERASKIDLKEGVSRQEAIIIAQNELLKSEYKDKYDATKPSISYDEGCKTWGIGFELKKGCVDEDYWGVLIKNDTGEVYSGPLRDL